MLLPTCRDMTTQSSQRLDRRLNWWRLPGEWLHLAFCGVCRRYRRQLRWMHHTSKQADLKINPLTPLTETSKDRIRQALLRAGTNPQLIPSTKPDSSHPPTHG